MYRLLIAFAALLLAGFVMYPPPKLSSRLKEWLDSGQYFQHKGHNIFYIDIVTKANSKAASSVICLHGFPTSSYDWYKILPDLQKHFHRVVLLDFIGFGFSDKPVNHTYSIFEQADIVEDLLDNLEINDVHLLAHDYGDTVAQELLSRYNEKDRSKSLKHTYQILSVCLLNGGIYPESHSPRPIQKILLQPYIGAIASRLMFFQSFRFSFNKVFGPDTQPADEELEDFWAAMRWKDGHAIFHRLIKYIPERQSNKDRWVGVLKDCSIPIKIIYGPADPVNPPIKFIPHSKNTAPKVGLYVLSENIGHYPQLEDPSGVVEEYLKFLTPLKIAHTQAM
ncbi:mesoderm-specific transcript protein-like isoform X1 [Tubulanus polymorphus]|uniref:mesoderm-specific transcript protein-like isoform X1 n=1 Tax=Tubulanus polymorphus TaxID=672921 RepID=UPI003DA54835